MPLPEKVVEQLGREPSDTQGWALGAIFFSGGILFLAVALYFGLTQGYEPYLQSQLSSTQGQVTTLDQSIPPGDQAELINFYSQIANLQALLQEHKGFSQFFGWLEQNTQANTYYSSLSVLAGGQVSLSVTSKTEADVNQQLDIFENAPDVSSVSISGLNAPALPGGGWNYGLTLVMNPSVFLMSTSTSQ